MTENEPIWELEIIGVLDRGIANKERVLIRSVGEVDIKQYLLCIGWHYPAGEAEDFPMVVPVNNRICFFPTQVIEPDSWVVVYTGEGEPQISNIPTTHETAYTFHWGFKSVLFSTPRHVPFLFRWSGTGIPPTSEAVLPAPHSPPRLK